MAKTVVRMLALAIAGCVGPPAGPGEYEPARPHPTKRLNHSAEPVHEGKPDAGTPIAFPNLTVERKFFRLDAGAGSTAPPDAGAASHTPLTNIARFDPLDGSDADARAAFTDAGSVAQGRINNASRVVGNMRSDFRGCYAEALTRFGGFACQVAITINVISDGSVGSARAAGVNAPSDLLECLLTVVGSRRFDLPTGGSAVVKVPVLFRPQGRH
jgi:hypothetical protein